MKTKHLISSIYSLCRLVSGKRNCVGLLMILCLSGKPVLQAQDCFPDLEPPVLICKKIDTLMLGWCGNEQVYAWEFVNYTVDNCSKYVKITFDKEGKLEWIESYFLLIGLNTSNNFITIYAHDNAGNVSECSSYCLPVSISNYTVKCTLKAHYNYTDELDKIQLAIRTGDSILHPTSLIKNSNPLDFRAAISNIASLKSIALNALDIPFKYWNISTADVIETSRMIIGNSKYASDMNYLSADTNCDGEVNLLDIYKTYDYILGKIDKDDCLAKPLLRFLSDSGQIIGTEIEYNLIQTKVPNIGFCQRGDINREVYLTNFHIENPVSQISGSALNWKTRNQKLIKDQSYLIDFELSDSIYFFGLQCNFNFDTNLIQIDTFSTNVNSFYGFHQYPDDVQIVWINLSTPKFEHQYPKISFQIKAKANAMLQDVFKLVNHSITNMGIDANGSAFPIGIKFSKNIAGPKMELEELNLVVKTNLWNDDVLLIGKIHTNTTGYVKLFNLAGELVLNKAIQVTNGNINEQIAIQKPGFYLLQFESADGIRKSIRFQKF